MSYLKEKKLKRIAVNVIPPIKTKIRLAADHEEMTISDWIRQAIDRQLMEYEKLWEQQ